MMADDGDFCYMVSTVTSLAPFYGPIRVTEILCSMMLDGADHSQEIRYKYEVQRSPIRVVISKIVESIFLNVINAGHQTGGIPRQLHHLHAHTTDHSTFARIVQGIQRAEGDVLLVCENFIADVTSWLLYHFHGHLEVSVGNNILLSKKLGNTRRTIRLIVQKTCSEPDKCFLREGPGTIEVPVAAGDGTYTTFLRGTDSAGLSDSQPRMHSRQPLYHEDSTATNLYRTEKNHIIDVAKKIISWLLNVSLDPAPSSSSLLNFRANLDGGDGFFHLRDILVAHPTILHKNTGHTESHAPVYAGVSESSVSTVGDALGTEALEQEDDLLTPSGILSCFPLAQDMVDTITKRCTCYECESGTPLKIMKAGCLGKLAIVELFVILAHAISEGLGARDVSGLSKPDEVAATVMVVLFRLLRHKIILWDDWFSVAAVTTAGASFQIFSEDRRNRGVSEIASLIAVQNGCFVAVAPWVSLQREVCPKNSFCLEFFDGNIRGLTEELGIIRCEAAMESTGTSSATYGSEVLQDGDEAEVEASTAIFRTGSSVYRLMTLVKSGSCIRMVDPTRRIYALCRSEFASCPHDSEEDRRETAAFKKKVLAYRFEDVLATWDRSCGDSDVIPATQVLNNRLKFNVILALSVNGVVVRDVRSCCLQCAVEEVRRRAVTQPMGVIQTRLNRDRRLTET
jgi:hypothetical protein